MFFLGYTRLSSDTITPESVVKMYQALDVTLPGKLAFINVIANLSVDCDCCAEAEDPCMKDIGILSSLGPVALDQACVNLIYASKDMGRDHFLKRLESRHGIHTIEAAAQHGHGSREYELIEIKKQGQLQLSLFFI